MEASFLCPDCGHEHGDPAEAILGLRVRCLDCQVEIDLAEEFRLMPYPLVAA